MKKETKSFIALFLIMSFIPLILEIVMFMVQIPMPRVERFPLYVQPLIWGYGLSLFGLIIFLGGKFIIDNIKL